MSSAKKHTGMCCLLALIVGHAANADTPEDGPGTVTAGAQAAILSPSLLDQSVMIGTITVDNRNIFDLDNPDEDKALYRLLNRLHVKTRPNVIEEQLLLQPGELFSSQLMAESERLLRSNRYIQEVTIKPVLSENGEVDVNVTTSDSWTLIPKVDASRSGGKNKTAIGIEELNLLGTGIGVGLQYRSDVDRDSAMLKIEDRNLGSSRYALATVVANNSDGYTRYLQLEKPFYALDSRDAKGITFYDNDQIESFYDLGETVSDYRHQTRQQELVTGWSRGLQDGWTKRYTTGLALDEHRFSRTDESVSAQDIVPEDRKFLYPFVGIEILEDRYEKGSNYDQINRVEDRYLGTRFAARLGLANEGAGSDRNAWLFNAEAQTSFASSETGSVHLSADLGGRVEGGAARNMSLGMKASYYKRQSEKRLLYLGLSGTYGYALDLDQYKPLGGDDGLRGYPLRYQTGDKSAQLTIEQRYFTDWYPFRLFHVGGAVFFDAGRAWGESPVNSSNQGWLKDVGFGLRIGNARSGLGRMTHIDVAFPLDGGSDISNVQFIVSTRKSF